MGLGKGMGRLLFGGLSAVALWVQGNWVGWAAEGWELTGEPQNCEWRKQRSRSGCLPLTQAGPPPPRRAGSPGPGMVPCKLQTLRQHSQSSYRSEQPTLSPRGGAYAGNLADSDSEAIRSEEFLRGHSHAPLLRLPTVFLDLLREGPGSAQAMAPQTHTDRPTQRDTSGTPGGRGTASQSPQGPLRVSEMNHMALTLAPGLEPAGRDRHAGVCETDRECPPSCPSRPITARSPGTCGVRPGSSFEGPLSSDPALHPSLPACSGVTQLREAPAEGRGPKLLTAGPIPYQAPNFHIHLRTIFLPRMDPGSPELGSQGGMAHGRSQVPTLLVLSAQLSASSGVQIRASYGALSSQQWAAPPPGSPGSSTAERACRAGMRVINGSGSGTCRDWEVARGFRRSRRGAVWLPGPEPR